MAYAVVVSPPGTKYGPCKEPCNHVDCAASRGQASALCVYCGKPIGYASAWITEQNRSVAHWTCALDAAEAV